jgi:hypothetical protein
LSATIGLVWGGCEAWWLALKSLAKMGQSLPYEEDTKFQENRGYDNAFNGVFVGMVSELQTTLLFRFDDVD